MSPLFLKKVRRDLRCPHCTAAKARRRSVCDRHLAEVRDRWSLYSFVRRAAGRCSYCDRRTGRAGAVRCEVHRRENVARVRRWHAAHGVAADRRARARQLAIVRAAWVAGDTRSAKAIYREHQGFRARDRAERYANLQARYPHLVDKYRSELVR